MMAFPLDSALFMLEMKRNQWKSEAQIESLQERLLQELVSYARANVPHYKKTLGPAAPIRSLEDIRHLPIFHKEDVLASPDSFISRAVDKSALKSKVTSGTTGVPLTIYSDRRDCGYAIALEQHQLTEVGVGPFDLKAHITYYSLEPTLLQRLGLFRRVYLTRSTDGLETLRALQRIRPDVLQGMPSFLIALARANLDHDARFNVRTVVSFSEVLTPQARRFISSSFGCQVRDMYGSAETHWIGWECDRGSMHMNSDSLIVEILDKHGEPVPDGAVGDIVVTPLWRRAMPFIRYFSGDRGSFQGRCACGRHGLKVLGPIEGRTAHFFMLDDGTICPSYLADHVMRSVPEVLQYQLVQEEAGKLRVLLVLSAPLSGREKLLSSCTGMFDGKLDISLEVVDHIGSGKNGKARDFISKIKRIGEDRLIRME